MLVLVLSHGEVLRCALLVYVGRAATSVVLVICESRHLAQILLLDSRGALHFHLDLGTLGARRCDESLFGFSLPNRRQDFLCYRCLQSLLGRFRGGSGKGVLLLGSPRARAEVAIRAIQASFRLPLFLII